MTDQLEKKVKRCKFALQNSLIPINLVEKNERFQHNWNLAVKLLGHIYQYPVCADCYIDLLKSGKIQLLN